jgi:hypothetical protein
MEQLFTEPRLVLFSPDVAVVDTSRDSEPDSLVGRTIHLPTSTRRERLPHDGLSKLHETSSDLYSQIVTPPSSDFGPMALHSIPAPPSENRETRELRLRLEKIKERRARHRNQRVIETGTTSSDMKAGRTSRSISPLQGDPPLSIEEGLNRQQQQLPNGRTSMYIIDRSREEIYQSPAAQDPVIILKPLPKHEAGAVSTCRTFDETIDTKSWTSIPVDVTKNEGWNLRRLICSSTRGQDMHCPKHWQQNHPLQRPNSYNGSILDNDIPGQLSRTDESQGGRRLRLDIDSVICSRPLHGDPTLSKDFSFRPLQNDEEDDTDKVIGIEVPEGIMLEENVLPINAAPQFYIDGRDVTGPDTDKQQKEHQRVDIVSLDDVVPRGPAYSEIYSEDSQFHDDLPNSSCLRLANHGPWYLRSDKRGKGLFPDGIDGDNEECTHTMHAVVFMTT